MRKIRIAIDGYAGCGKSTLAKDLANELDYLMIDSGAMYRALTWLSLQLKTDLDQDHSIQKLLDEVNSLEFDDENNHALLNGHDIEDEIRTDKDVAAGVSKLAAIPEVRDFLRLKQQRLSNKPGVVMEGRDIGTVIMPKAEVKLFITASLDARVHRRMHQLELSGQKLNLEEVKENLASRDQKDATRSMAPLKRADDAIIIDTSNLSKEEQLKMVMAIISPLINDGLLPYLN